MSRKEPSLLKEFSYLPWWASVIAGALVYFTLNYIFPALDIKNPIILLLVTVGQKMSWLFAGLFLLPAISSIFIRKKRRQLFNQQESIETLRKLSWSDFEVLVGEAFRRKGFTVQENMVGGADGGIDLRLYKDKKLQIVQCKQWKKSKVGVAIVREMFGVMKAVNAERVYVVCSGDFTKEAINFAKDLPIDLINGEQLLELMAKVQGTQPTKKLVTTEAETIAPSLQCPKCASPLVKRIAKKGVNIGKEFWGCSSFPKCRHIQQ